MDTEDPETLFDQEWAAALAVQAWDRVRANFDPVGGVRFFEEARPFVLGGSATPGITIAARRLGISADALQSQIRRLRWDYRACLRDEVGRTVSGLSEIDGEMRHLRRVLSQGSLRSMAGSGEEGAAGTPACVHCGAALVPPGPEGGCVQCSLRVALIPEDSTEAGYNVPETIPDRAGTPGRFGHYDLIFGPDGLPVELGRGAMGVTYRAQDSVLHCAVALKIIESAAAEFPAVRARFLHEARLAARLRHQNVASVFHYGEQDGFCFYAMELVEGETLDAKVRRDGPLSPAMSLEIALQVCRALSAAETYGLVHRDLKPSNLMLAAVAGHHDEASETVAVKVIDFGLARASADGGADEELSVFVGTPAFASPEQFVSGNDARVVDARADIYALGGTLWFLVSGAAPFAGCTLEEIRERKKSQPPPLERLAAANVPDPMVQLLRTLLAIDPAERPQTPRELGEVLRRCREELAATDPAVRQRRRAVRRRVLTSVGLTFFILAIAAGIAWRRGMFSPEVIPPGDKSIAVLPFENLSANPDDASLAAGMQDGIINDLVSVADLKVIARFSTQAYRPDSSSDPRKIGASLNVAQLLEGSIRRTGQRVSATVQLIDARDGRQRWTQKFERDVADIFAIQDDIAGQVVTRLQGTLPAADGNAFHLRPTTDLAAYDLYLRAKELFLSDTFNTAMASSLTQAVELLDSAVARDPKFFLAWCLLARAHDDIYWTNTDHTPARLTLAEGALAQARRLRPGAGELHLIEGVHLYHAKRDYPGALAELTLASRALPNDADTYLYSGAVYRRSGRWEESVRDFRKSLTLNPRGYVLLEELWINYQAMRLWKETAEVLRQRLALTPHDPRLRMESAMIAILARADTQPAREMLTTIWAEGTHAQEESALYGLYVAWNTRDYSLADRALALLPSDVLMAGNVHYPRAFLEGLTARFRGDEVRAVAAFKTARAQVDGLSAQSDFAEGQIVLGTIDAALGRKEEAIREGRRALELLPISHDALTGPKIANDLVMIYVMTGELDQALDLMEKIILVPGAYSYGGLRLSPYYDPLRGNPRFEALVARLAPSGG